MMLSVSEIGLFCLLFLSPFLLELCPASFFFFCLLHSCVATSISTVTYPVNHVSLGALFSRHDNANQLPEEAVLVFVSLPDSSNKKKYLLYDKLRHWLSCQWVWHLSTLTAFLLQYGTGFLLLLPKSLCPGSASLNLSRVPATLISCSLWVRLYLEIFLLKEIWM